MSTKDESVIDNSNKKSEKDIADDELVGNKTKELAEETENTIFRRPKIAKMEKLALHGKAAAPYLIDIGNKSRSPLIKTEALRLVSEILAQDESG